MGGSGEDVDLVVQTMSWYRELFKRFFEYSDHIQKTADYLNDMSEIDLATLHDLALRMKSILGEPADDLVSASRELQRDLDKMLEYLDTTARIHGKIPDCDVKQFHDDLDKVEISLVTLFEDTGNKMGVISKPKTLEYLADCWNKVFGDTHKKHNDPNQPKMDGKWGAQTSLILEVLHGLVKNEDGRPRIARIFTDLHGHIDLALQLFGYFSSPENGGGTQIEQVQFMKGPYEALLRVIAEQRMGYDNLMEILIKGLYPLRTKMDIDERIMLFELKKIVRTFLSKSRILLGQWLVISEMDACLKLQTSKYVEITETIDAMCKELEEFAADIEKEKPDIRLTVDDFDTETDDENHQDEEEEDDDDDDEKAADDDDEEAAKKAADIRRELVSLFEADESPDDKDTLPKSKKKRPREEDDNAEDASSTCKKVSV